MQDSNKSVFKQGFIFGFGLIIPLIIGYVGYSTVSYKLFQMFSSDDGSHNPYESYEAKEENNIKNIAIQEFKDVREGNFVMVLGSIKNTSDIKIGSIKLEAEFYNSKGEFVYEESEYISKKLAPNEVENFAIKCGCTNRTFPEYSKVVVRVVGASSF